ncbi:hypothetical protein ABGB17_20270 [Sphaerisporangium sp. B11E5]|uniref:hypothetical protein n=1 Tax=Sphaerisporangium sp. B11E5 TaxID=3153563 RepID=UPI00325EB9B2
MDHLKPAVPPRCPITWCRGHHSDRATATRLHDRNVELIDPGDPGLTTEIDLQQEGDQGTPRVRMFIGEADGRFTGRHVDISPLAAAELGRLISHMPAGDLRFLGAMLSRAGALVLGE